MFSCSRRPYGNPGETTIFAASEGSTESGRTAPNGETLRTPDDELGAEPQVGQAAFAANQDPGESGSLAPADARHTLAVLEGRNVFDRGDMSKSFMLEPRISPIFY
jgi:hypothetical protein